MPVTAKLSRKFYEKLGDDVANELVEWFNVVDATYRSDLTQLNDLNFARFDANYRTDLLGGLTATAAVIYTGTRAAGSRPQASLGGKQLMLPGYATVDLGLRHQFKINSATASFRVVVQNLFDTAQWRVVGANTLTVEERRRLLVTLAADF